MRSTTDRNGKIKAQPQGDDKTLLAAQLSVVLRSAVRRSERTQASIAHYLDISEGYLSLILSGAQVASVATYERIAEELGYTFELALAPIGRR